MKHTCRETGRIFYNIEGAHKCKGLPAHNRRVWFQRTHTGSGTIYLFNERPKTPVTGYYANYAMGWISEEQAQNIRLSVNQGYCNFWKYITIEQGYECVLDDVIEFTDELDKCNTAEAMHLIARRTNFIFQVGPWKTDSSQLQLKETKMDHYAAKVAVAQNKNANGVFERVIDNNKTAVQAAGFLEAGRIANKELSKALAPMLPYMVRGYADTPVGRLVLANMAQVAAQHFKSNNKALQQLVGAMTTQAYAEVIQTAGVEEFVEKLLANEKIKSALAQVSPE